MLPLLRQAPTTFGTLPDGGLLGPQKPIFGAPLLSLHYKMGLGFRVGQFGVTTGLTDCVEHLEI